MTELPPTVRYLIVCEDVQIDVQNPRRVSLVGLIGSIRSLEDPPFPLLYPELCVFVQLSECRGPARGRIEIVHEDSEQIVARTQDRRMPLSNDPLEVIGVSFRLRNCLFSVPGLHWVRFCYDDQVIAQHALLLR